MLPAETDALAGLPHLAVAVYALALRPRKRPCGRVDTLTHADVAAAVAIRPRRGAAGVLPTVAAVRHALSVLVGAGLVEMASRGRQLVVRLPLVPTVSEVQQLKTAQPCGFPGEVQQQDDGTTTAENRMAPRLFAVGAAAGAEFPPSSPLPFPPYNPPIPSPLLTPSDGPQTVNHEDTPQRITPDWRPIPETLLALRQKGIAEDAAIAEVAHFRLYWAQAPASKGRKRPAKWQLAFVNWCLADSRREKARHGAGRNALTGSQQDETAQRNRQRERDKGAAGRQADAIREFFDRDRAAGDT